MRRVAQWSAVAFIGLVLAGCTYWDGGMRPDDPVRASRMKSAFNATIVGQTTRHAAEAALGRPYCRRSLANGEVALSWGGLSTKINEVHFLGVRTRRYVVTGQWDMSLGFKDDILVERSDAWHSADSGEPCVVTCSECRYRSLGATGEDPFPSGAKQLYR